MRKLLLFILASLLLAVSSKAQDPVKWTFSAKKISDKNYEIHVTATIARPWNIYSQTTPEGGPLPTAIAFNKNPLVSFDGKIKENGTLKKKFEEVFDVDVLYYKDSVDFIQVVKVKNAAKTALTGTVEFMACNDEQCLPPKSIPFTISLN